MSILLGKIILLIFSKILLDNLLLVCYNEKLAALAESGQSKGSLDASQNVIGSKPAFDLIGVIFYDDPHDFKQTLFSAVRPIMAHGIPRASINFPTPMEFGSSEGDSLSDEPSGEFSDFSHCDYLSF